MNLKVFLLLIVSLFLFHSGVSSQVLLEQLHERNTRLESFKRNNLKGDVKMVTYKKFSLEKARLVFNLLLLNYTQKYSSTTECHFNKEGKVLKKESNYNKKNSSGYNNFFWEYGDNYINQVSISNRDTTEQVLETFFHSTYNEDGKLKTFTLENTLEKREVEEVEYFNGGKKCNIYELTDTSKIKTKEFVFDENDNQLSSIIKFWHDTYLYEVSETYYNNEGRVTHSINRPNISSDNSPFDTSIGYVEGPITGSYYSYFYNAKGLLKKIKIFSLAGENINGKVKYWKERLYVTYRYKEKKIKNYITRKVSVKAVDGASKTYSREILDQQRNKIAEYIVLDRGDAFLYLWDITYY